MCENGGKSQQREVGTESGREKVRELCFGGVVGLINFSDLYNFCRLPLHLGSGDISLVRLHVFEVIIQR